MSGRRTAGRSEGRVLPLEVPVGMMEGAENENEVGSPTIVVGSQSSDLDAVSVGRMLVTGGLSLVVGTLEGWTDGTTEDGTTEVGAVAVLEPVSVGPDWEAEAVGSVPVAVADALPEAVPDAESVAEADPVPEAVALPELVAEAEAVGSVPVAVADALPEPVPDAESVAEAEPVPDAESVADADPVPETVALPELDAESVAEADPVPETVPEAEPESEAVAEADGIGSVVTMPDVGGKLVPDGMLFEGTDVWEVMISDRLGIRVWLGITVCEEMISDKLGIKV